MVAQTAHTYTMASVFVRNLPFGVTQEELEHVFSDVGPVKKIDIIKDKGKRRDEILTRGFAFVKLYVQLCRPEALCWTSTYRVL